MTKDPLSYTIWIANGTMPPCETDYYNTLLSCLQIGSLKLTLDDCLDPKEKELVENKCFSFYSL